MTRLSPTLLSPPVPSDTMDLTAIASPWERAVQWITRHLDSADVSELVQLDAVTCAATDSAVSRLLFDLRDAIAEQASQPVETSSARLIHAGERAAAFIAVVLERLARESRDVGPEDHDTLRLLRGALATAAPARVLRDWAGVLRGDVLEHLESIRVNANTFRSAVLTVLLAQGLARQNAKDWFDLTPAGNALLDREPIRWMVMWEDWEYGCRTTRTAHYRTERVARQSFETFRARGQRTSLDRLR